ncbi:DNA repair exonuclease [Methylocella tundrae]|uniref:DNA repair exonuclease n=1 Tax=Methylocella tundrae TaxID=227605 RepID=A0A8B6MD06_METTU|nr:DNA repair exonuclease [Methylocella tundrae]VTZ52319.1 DNA repair exonuclease [Methylocella tundrae]
MRFRFIHAADLHLDSPLLGLSKKSQDFAARVDDASRRAFDNLVALAIEEECRLVVIAGDVFDGQWRDYRTGQFFADRMRRLREKGVRVVMIFGNHDAENRFASRLDLSDNVSVLPSKQSGTVLIDEIETAVHGQSFAQREVLDNIALAYPRPIAGRFNIGLLHTAGSGREGHASYAPCSLEQLANHGYHYWALGHIHAREQLWDSPPIIFPGNLQARSIKETGAKGVTLVTVEDGAVASLEHRPLDVVRFAAETIDVSGLADREELFAAIRRQAEAAFATAEDRALALRVKLTGASALHADLMTDARNLREEVETLLASIASDIWLEKLAIETAPPPLRAGVDPTIAGGLRLAIEELAESGWLRERLSARLADIKTKLPASAHQDELLAELKAEGCERARALALALIEKGQR